MTVDILRSAYITHFYSDPRKTLKDKEELARLMRHSAATAQREYQKIDVGNVGHPDNLVITSAMMSSPPEVPSPVIQKKEYFNLREWRAKYRRANRDDINKKARDEYQTKKMKFYDVIFCGT